jgi:exonuclease SbcC
MANLHLKSIDVQAFRGIRESLKLELGKRLTIIYGGNATGKSSIAQAIEFGLSGRVTGPEDDPIAARYLANTLKNGPGKVKLELSDGVSAFELTAATNEAQNSIEARFRDKTSVDWPEKQSVPVTTTHITSQGALARVLAPDYVTRSDLTGLCAGAELRSMLARATRLADLFRQASAGRNIRADLNTARAAYEAASVLHESLEAVGGASSETELDAKQLLLRLAGEFNLPQIDDLDDLVQSLAGQINDADRNLSAIQALLIRMRDLGQYEAELTQLQAQIDSGRAAEQSYVSARATLVTALEQQRDRENEIVANLNTASTVLAASERYQRFVSVMSSLEARVVLTKQSVLPLQEHIASLSKALATANEDHRVVSADLVRVTSGCNAVRVQLAEVRKAIGNLSHVPESALEALDVRVSAQELSVNALREQQGAVESALQAAVETASLAEARYRKLSESDAKFSAAAEELEELLVGDACSLCGHHHGSRAALESAIRAVKDSRLTGSTTERRQFEAAAEERRVRTESHSRLLNQLRMEEAALKRAQQEASRLKRQREDVLSLVTKEFTRIGLPVDTSDESLSKLTDDLVARLADLEVQLESYTRLEMESRRSRDDLEQAMAERMAEVEQLKRFCRELEDQVAKARDDQPEAISADTASTARAEATRADSALAAQQHAAAKIQTAIAEQDRLIGDARAQGAGAQRRLEVINGLLDGLDRELNAVGANRDIEGLLEIERQTRQQRDLLVTQNARVQQVREGLRQIDRNRARVEAVAQFRGAQARLEMLQRRQKSLSMRASQFADLQKSFELAQSRTAEEVLRNVRVPVGLMFRAMTAGCQWEIEFALTEGGHVQAKLLDGVGSAFPASSVLNSAYLNVSAIALRIALASQQNWTSLRTIVLDDPILEMDALTQSALIDGLEAILLSRVSPWKDLQLVINTWSEDFAVLSAHKLAHMNSIDDLEENQFAIYRLGSLPNGDVVAERHAPRWKARANAA